MGRVHEMVWDAEQIDVKKVKVSTRMAIIKARGVDGDWLRFRLLWCGGI